jgi:demethylmenaquinone methyltransferase / 2-methoxy-6-polyprenyl-1,4-benzoquinol methylase
MNQGETTHFGARDVPLDEKQDLVDDVFHKVAARYDLMNDVMSFGAHRLWKDALVAKVRAPKTGVYAHLDVAGGTGDVAFRIAAQSSPDAVVTVLDINADMLKVGEERAAKRKDASKLRFVEGNAEALPFPDKTFDGYTVAFGIRNVPRIDKALSEAFRVLKRGGKFLCLEFSHVDVPGLDALYDRFSFSVIPQMGRLIAKDAESYRYLVESIRKFPPPAAFADQIRRAGFERVGFERLSGGIVAIHSGWKL